jgi:UDP-glucose 4-epimerase
MNSKINCGITGSTGVLGSAFINKKFFNFIRFKGDITNKIAVNKWIYSNKFDLIIHFAAIVPTHIVQKDYKKALRVNFKGTKYLIDSIVKNNINLKWFFFSSTSHVYASSKKKINEKNLIRPISKYGFTKIKAEQYIKRILGKKKINYCIGRIFSFTDKKQKSSFLVPSLKKKFLQKNKIIKLYNLNHYRDFLSVNDICYIIYFLWEKNFCGIINIASGKKIYLKDIAIFLMEKYKKKVKFIDTKKNTSLLADVHKIKQLGWKQKEINFYKLFK